VTIPLCRKEKFLEVSSCHIVPSHAEALASVSNSIASKTLIKRAEEKEQAHG